MAPTAPTMQQYVTHGRPYACCQLHRRELGRCCCRHLPVLCMLVTLPPLPRPPPGALVGGHMRRPVAASVAVSCVPGLMPWQGSRTATAAGWQRPVVSPGVKSCLSQAAATVLRMHCEMLTTGSTVAGWKSTCSRRQRALRKLVATDGNSCLALGFSKACRLLRTS